MAKKKILKGKTMRIDKYCGPGMKCGSGGCIYFLGFIGALVYYISISTGFWNGVLGSLKSTRMASILSV